MPLGNADPETRHIPNLIIWDVSFDSKAPGFLPSRVIPILAADLRALCEADPKLALGLLQAAARAAIERLGTTRI